MPTSTIKALVNRIPEGSVNGVYQGKRYAISKRTYNDGRSCKIYAEALGGNDFVSLNFYQTAKGDSLKPCEMPEQKVVDFLRDVVLEE